ncbi:MAG: flagellar hook-length control protein FliK [Desulfobacteraceae bacterium]|jgi:hypothetical protein
MSSPLNPFSGNFLKSLSLSGGTDLKGSTLIKGVVEKNLSLFEYSLKTDLGKISLFSDSVFTKGDMIKMQVSSFKNNALMIFDENGNSLKFNPSKEFLNSLKGGGDTSVSINGSVEKTVSLPKFLISTGLGSVEAESDIFLKKGDTLNLDLKEVKNFLSSKDVLSHESIKTSLLSKFPVKEILKILDKNFEKNITDFMKSASKIDSAGSQKSLEKIFENLTNPSNSSGREVKNSVSYFLGSNFDAFQEDLKNLKESLLKFQAEKGSLKSEELKNTIERTDKFLETMQDQKNLNSLRFADSSKMYFFLPFQGRDSGFGEFFIEHGRKDRQGRRELRAVVKLDLSNLGLLMADLRLAGKNLKVYFGVESGGAKNIIDDGFHILKNNLKKAGFNEVLLFCSVVEKQKIKESLIKEFIKDKDDDSTLSIIA